MTEDKSEPYEKGYYKIYDWAVAAYGGKSLPVDVASDYHNVGGVE